MRFPYQHSAILLGTAALVIVQPQAAKALEAAEINQIAEKVTVLITDGSSQGSGVLIAKEGNTYYVLTAKHVIPGQIYRLRTPDGKEHNLNEAIIHLPGVDLAIAQFTSSSNYTLAKLGDSDRIGVGARVYVSGWPRPGATITTSIRQLTTGEISARQRVDEGYELIYTNPTRAGMSGGPVLNEAGEVIGIHGRFDGEADQDVIKGWVSLGIPIQTFLNLAPEAYAQQGEIKLRTGNYAGAIADFNQGISFNSRAAVAYLGRGYAQFAQKNYQQAIDDASQALTADANSVKAYLLRGASHAQRNNHTAAIADFDRAIQRDSQLLIAYGLRSISKAKTQDYVGANQDAARAIQLAPNSPIGYFARAGVRENTGDAIGATEDRNLAQQKNAGQMDGYQLALNQGLGWSLPGATVARSPEPPPRPEPPRSTTPPPPEPVRATPPTRSPATPPPVVEQPQPIATNRSNEVSSAQLSSLFTVEREASITAVAISPDGKTVALGKKGGYIDIIDAQNGNLRLSLPGHVRGIRSLAFSPDGTKLISGGEDVTAKLWEVRSGNLLHTIDAVNAQVHSVAFTPSGQSVVIGMGNGKVQIWLVNNGQLFRDIPTQSSGIFAVAVSPDGTKLAAAGVEGSIYLWSLPDGELLDTLSGHDGSVRALAFSKDGQTLISGGFDQHIRFWDANTGQLRHAVDTDLAINSLAVSANGDTVAMGSPSQIVLWSLTGSRTGEPLNIPSQSLAFSADGQQLVSGSNDGMARAWRVNR